MSKLVPEGKRVALLVTGSREWVDVAVLRARLQLYPRGTVLLHGGARGADSQAHHYGTRNGFVVWPLFYYSDLQKRGGHARNRTLVRLLNVLALDGFLAFAEAFPRGESSGTRGCIALIRSDLPDIPLCVTEGQ